MVDFQCKNSYGVKDLEEIVRLLRAPGGCPWDAEQTHESIRRNFLEEAYEVVEAIDEESPAHLQEELGDVLLQVVLHTRMEQEKGGFTLDDVADGICKKLIYRHPHVFGEVTVSGTDQVLANWEELKRKEKGQATHTDALSAVAKSLPALWRAEKVQKKAKKAGFDWPEVSGALDKLSEETEELRQAIREASNVEEELGDLLFAAVNVARFVHSDPEEALSRATDKFISRFQKVEQAARAQGRQLEEMSLEEMDKLWEQVKHSSETHKA
jgi:tetrapyrrole methylase family protein/MazG family protein